MLYVQVIYLNNTEYYHMEEQQLDMHIKNRWMGRRGPLGPLKVGGPVPWYLWHISGPDQPKLPYIFGDVEKSLARQHQ